MLFIYLTLDVILSILAISILIQFFNIIFRGYAPFISTKGKVIIEIFSQIKFDENFKGKVYELGAGQAGFLRRFEEKYKNAELVGVEYSLIPYLISKFQLGLFGSKIIIQKKNFFKIDLSDADVIYCYLSSKTMKTLEKKFQKECKKGTVIISYQFIMPNLKPDKILELGEFSRVYVYKI
jgi:hypothetical protein